MDLSDYPGKGHRCGECRHFELLGVCGYGQCIRLSLDVRYTKPGFTFDRACTGYYEAKAGD